MVAALYSLPTQDELIARVTDIAYRKLLERGIQGSFVDLQLDLWYQMRGAFEQAGPEQN